MTKSKLRKNVTKINMRVTAKRHAHRQTLKKFEKDLAAKTARKKSDSASVAPPYYDTYWSPQGNKQQHISNQSPEVGSSKLHNSTFSAEGENF